MYIFSKLYRLYKNFNREINIIQTIEKTNEDMGIYKA